MLITLQLQEVFSFVVSGLGADEIHLLHPAFVVVLTFSYFAHAIAPMTLRELPQSIREPSLRFVSVRCHLSTHGKVGKYAILTKEVISNSIVKHSYALSFLI